MRWIAGLVVAAGCGFAPVASETPPPGDATDAPIDASCLSTCQDAETLLDCTTNQPVTCPLGCHADPQAGDRCAWPTPSNGATLADLGPHDLVITANATLETATGGITEDTTGTVIRTAGTGTSPEGYRFDPLGADRGVLGVRSLAIAGGVTLRVAGPRVLIVLAGGDIDIQGTLDASAGKVSCSAPSIAQCGGPGGGTGGALDTDGTGCSPGKHGFDGSGDETGGGGGGYGSPAGGNGGDGNNAGGAGGTGNCSVTALDPIAGGSGGGGGGAGGAGGGGGGAVQLTALGNVRIHTIGGAARASVRANGAGGKGGASGTGGGGGGSAGAILLEGQTVVVDGATLVANGGGGGAGDNGNDGSPGGLDVNPAPGGTQGRTGGEGAARNGTPGNGTGGADGTGGGGGGIGRIFVNSGMSQYMLLNGTIVSPVEYNATAQPM